MCTMKTMFSMKDELGINKSLSNDRDEVTKFVRLGLIFKLVAFVVTAVKTGLSLKLGLINCRVVKLVLR